MRLLEKGPACILGDRHLKSAHTPAAWQRGDSGVQRALACVFLG